MIILEENFKRHLEAFASELFNCKCLYYVISYTFTTTLIGHAHHILISSKRVLISSFSSNFRMKQEPLFPLFFDEYASEAS